MKAKMGPREGAQPQNFTLFKRIQKIEVVSPTKKNLAEGSDNLQGSVHPRFGQICFCSAKILEYQAFCDSVSKIPQFFQNSPWIPWNPRTESKRFSAYKMAI